MTRQKPRRRSFGPTSAQAASGRLVKALSSRLDVIEPEFLRWLYTMSPYETEEYVPSATGRNRLGIVGFDGEFPSDDDLARFMTLFSERTEGATFDVVQVNGGTDNPVLGPASLGDANSNMQYASAMAFPTPIVFYSIGGFLMWNEDTGMELAGDRYLEWFDYMLAKEPNIPQTISISYGDVELALPLEYRKALCDLFARLGSLGVSVLVASGNAGVGGEDCKDEHGDVRFVPEFPSSCKCVVLSPLSSTRQGEVHISHQTTSQVPGSLASVALKASPRLRRATPEAASRRTFRARNTKSPWSMNT